MSDIIPQDFTNKKNHDSELLRELISIGQQQNFSKKNIFEWVALSITIITLASASFAAFKELEGDVERLQIDSARLEKRVDDVNDKSTSLNNILDDNIEQVKTDVSILKTNTVLICDKLQVNCK